MARPRAICACRCACHWTSWARWGEVGPRSRSRTPQRRPRNEVEHVCVFCGVKYESLHSLFHRYNIHFSRALAFEGIRAPSDPAPSRWGYATDYRTVYGTVTMPKEKRLATSVPIGFSRIRSSFERQAAVHAFRGVPQGRAAGAWDAHAASYRWTAAASGATAETVSHARDWLARSQPVDSDDYT